MSCDISTRACHLSLSTAELILSTTFLPISLRLNIVFSSQLHQFLPSGVIPLASNVPFTQKFPAVNLLNVLLCSEENTLVCILNKIMLVHTVRHVSGRLILMVGALQITKISSMPLISILQLSPI